MVAHTLSFHMRHDSQRLSFLIAEHTSAVTLGFYFAQLVASCLCKVVVSHTQSQFLRITEHLDV